MKVGMTGTQNGASEHQKVQMYKFFEQYADDLSGFHHGDCIGADCDADVIAKNAGIPIVLHPPSNASKRAFCEGGTVRPERDYLKRNKDIVDETDMLLAIPEGAEKLRSGTWSTVRYARKQGKLVLIIWPDGETTTEKN